MGCHCLGFFARINEISSKSECTYVDDIAKSLRNIHKDFYLENGECEAACGDVDDSCSQLLLLLQKSIFAPSQTLQDDSLVKRLGQTAESIYRVLKFSMDDGVAFSGYKRLGHVWCVQDAMTTRNLFRYLYIAFAVFFGGFVVGILIILCVCSLQLIDFVTLLLKFV